MTLKPIPSEFKRRLSYCPDSGELTWVDHPNHFSKNGKPVRSTAVYEYKKVYLRNEPFLQHRVIWFMVTGDQPIGDIDHINGDIRDNRWSNLRLVTHKVNMNNRKKHVGVYFNPKNGVYTAHLQGRHLKKTRDKFEAWCWRKSAEAEYWSHQ